MVEWVSVAGAVLGRHLGLPLVGSLRPLPEGAERHGAGATGHAIAAEMSGDVPVGPDLAGPVLGRLELRRDHHRAADLQFDECERALKPTTRLPGVDRVPDGESLCACLIAGVGDPDVVIVKTRIAVYVSHHDPVIRARVEGERGARGKCPVASRGRVVSERIRGIVEHGEKGPGLAGAVLVYPHMRYSPRGTPCLQVQHDALERVPPRIRSGREPLSNSLLG